MASSMTNSFNAQPSSSLQEDQKKRRRKPANLPPPPVTAKIVSLATEPLQKDSDIRVDSEILDRIRKCLAKAHHPNTPEMEAKAALRMSSRLMSQYNVTQADVITQAKTAEDRAQLGGQSKVELRSTKSNDTKVACQNWVEHVVLAMKVFFDCDAYSTVMLYSVEWTFYGIATNTTAAAISFEMVHNLIMDWSRSKKAKRDYRLGISDGLRMIANKEKQEEERKAREKELRDMKERLERERDERQRELDRLNTPEPTRSPSAESESEVDSPEPDIKSEGDLSGDDFSDIGSNSEDSDDESTKLEPTFKQEDEKELDLNADLDEELKDMVKNAEQAEASNRLKNQPVSQWKTSKDLQLFRLSAEKVAKDYLESLNVRLSKKRASSGTIHNYDAYVDGKADSKKIDVKRKRIEDAPSKE